MMMETPLHFVSAIIIVLSAGVPIYLTFKLKKNDLRKLTLILIIFILIHAVYHIVGFSGFNLLAEGIFEPLSAGVLIFFGVVYSRYTKPTNTSLKNTLAGGIGVIPVVNNVIMLFIINSITMILLLIALSIFLWLAARSKNIRSFQFQISIFVVIWILGDMISILHDTGLVVFSSIQSDLGSEIHVISMLFFSIVLYLRYYYSERSGKKIVEDVNANSSLE
jgi:hypothetical protein